MECHHRNVNDMGGCGGQGTGRCHRNLVMMLEVLKQERGIPGRVKSLKGKCGKLFWGMLGSLFEV